MRRLDGTLCLERLCEWMIEWDYMIVKDKNRLDVGEEIRTADASYRLNTLYWLSAFVLVRKHSIIWLEVLKLQQLGRFQTGVTKRGHLHVGLPTASSSWAHSLIYPLLWRRSSEQCYLWSPFESTIFSPYTSPWDICLDLRRIQHWSERYSYSMREYRRTQRKTQNSLTVENERYK
jgi:hypothetical protein